MPLNPTACPASLMPRASPDEEPGRPPRSMTLPPLHSVGCMTPPDSQRHQLDWVPPPAELNCPSGRRRISGGRTAAIRPQRTSAAISIEFLSGLLRSRSRFLRIGLCRRFVDAVVDRVAALSERSYNWPRRPERDLLSCKAAATGETPVYSSDSIAWSSWKRVSSSLASEITKRTRPWFEVSA